MTTRRMALGMAFLLAGIGLLALAPSAEAAIINPERCIGNHEDTGGVRSCEGIKFENDGDHCIGADWDDGTGRYDCWLGVPF